MTHADFINLWPSLGAFADDISVKYGTAKAMRARNSIPPEYWGQMIEGAKARRIKGVNDTSLRLGVTAEPQRVAS